MSHSFDICIDESGDQGFAFDQQNSSHWFVISAVIGLTSRVPDMTARVLDAKRAINWKLAKHLHFKDVKVDKRELAVSTLMQDGTLFRSIVIMVHKPCLIDPESFQDDNRLYFYFTRYLLERASWLCRDSDEAKNKLVGDGTARVVFSKMNEISHGRIQEYFKHLQSFQTTIDWNVIREDQFETMAPTKHAGLQIADAVAGGFFCGDHPTEWKRSPRWCELWKPMLYRSRRGKYRGYGLKISRQRLKNASPKGRCPLGRCRTIQCRPGLQDPTNTGCRP